MDIKKMIRAGLIDENPTFVQLLGMCPTLAVTTTALNGLGMGITVIFVLVLSNFLISLLRKFIPSQVRIASYIVIISGVVTAIQLLIKAYLPALDKSLGLFIPLIVVNCIILARAEAFASKNAVLPSILDGVFMGLGFTLALTLLGIVREFLGYGTVFGLDILLRFGYKPILFFVQPAGAFITLGVLIATVNALRTKFLSASKKEENK
ncbi:MAG: electron transport complex subunit E [Ruminococcaceae bacterium]|nr:electron transport complex subunit E [Oscillospiraceae bacterium]